jgi:hypothetical protein
MGCSERVLLCSGGVSGGQAECDEYLDALVFYLAKTARREEIIEPSFNAILYFGGPSIS